MCVSEAKVSHLRSLFGLGNNYSGSKSQTVPKYNCNDHFLPGTARRKKKVIHKSASSDDKKLQTTLKKMQVSNIPGIEEVNIIREDGTVIHFTNPNVQATVQANTFAISGNCETKQISEMLPGILHHLVGMSSSMPKPTKPVEDDVPELIEDFDEACKSEMV